MRCRSGRRGPRVAAGHRRGPSPSAGHRQRTACRWSERRAARNRRREQPAEIAPGLTKRAKAVAIRRHGAAAVAAEEPRPRRRGGGERPRADAPRGRGRPEVERVDVDEAQAQLLERLGRNCSSRALGVEGAGDIGGRALVAATGKSRTMPLLTLPLAKETRVGGCSHRAGRRDLALPSLASGSGWRGARDVGDLSRRAAGRSSVEARTVRGPTSSRLGAPSPWARRTVRTRLALGGGAGGRRQRRAALVSRPSGRRSSRSCKPRSAASAAAAELLRDAAVTITPMRSATSMATPRFCSISRTAISSSPERFAQRCATC